MYVEVATGERRAFWDVRIYGIAIESGEEEGEDEEETRVLKHGEREEMIMGD